MIHYFVPFNQVFCYWKIWIATAYGNFSKFLDRLQWTMYYPMEADEELGFAENAGPQLRSCRTRMGSDLRHS